MSEVNLYRGASLLRSRPILAPYSRPTWGPVAVLGRWAVSYERGASVGLGVSGQSSGFRVEDFTAASDRTSLHRGTSCTRSLTLRKRTEFDPCVFLI